MLKIARHLMPASLEQRGAAVPFTTPALSLGRVRPDPRHHLVLSLRGFSGSGSYIVPWRFVPDLAPMSLHDKALHQEIATVGTISPGSVRQCALKVASSGLAGPEACEAAKHALEEDERKATETHFLLIVAFLAAVGVPVTELLNEDPKAGQWRDRARNLLTEAAGRAGLKAGGFFEKSAALSQSLAPVGLANAPSGSRVRELLRLLAEFKESVDAWAAREKSEFGAAAAFAGDLAETTMMRANHVLAQFDMRTLNAEWVLRDWQVEVTICRAIATRLAWLLDGWDHITAIWGAAQNAQIDRQREIISQLVPVLPIIPSNETHIRPTRSYMTSPGNHAVG